LLKVLTAGEGIGSVALNPPAGPYRFGSVVALTADPAEGSNFEGWSGDVSGSTNPVTIVMDGNKTVTASFDPVTTTVAPSGSGGGSVAPSLPVVNPTQYTITVTVSGQGSVSRSPSQSSYASGSTVQLTATPATGWVFTSWSGSLTGSAKTKTLTVDGNKAVTATFAQATQTQYTLTMQAPVGSGTTDPGVGAHGYQAGVRVDLTAYPASGWVFDHWRLNGVDASGSNPSYVTMDGGKTLQAVFTQATQALYTLSVTRAGSGSGSVTLSPSGGSYVSGTVVTLTTSPAEGSSFAGWSGDLSGTTNPTTIILNKDKSITASFTQIMSVTVPTSYKLTILGATGGTTNPTPGVHTYPKDLQVYISATPSTGYSLDYWLGDEVIGGSSGYVVMDKDKTLQPVFVLTTTPTTNDYIVSLQSGIYKAKSADGTILYSGTSASSAIQTALNSAKSGETVTIQAGTYSISSGLIIKSGVILTGSGSPTLDCSNAPTGFTCVTGSGTTGSKILLTADAAMGSLKISVSSTSGLSIGDLVFISSSEVWKGNSNSQPQGELRYISSINENTIILTSSLEDSYLKANSASIQKISPIKDVIISGLKFVNTIQYKNLHGVYFDYGVNVRVTGCYFDLIEYTAIRLYSCIDSRVDHNSVWRTWKDGEGYGTSIAWACQDVVVENNDYHQCRHATMIGGGGTLSGICRHITFQNNYAEDAVLLRSGSLVASHLYDTHNSGEDINFIGNEATGTGIGFDCELYSGTFRDNYIHDLTLYGMILHNPSKYSGPITIQNNRIINCVQYGIIVRTRNVEAMGNTVTNSKYGFLVESVNCKIHNNIITSSAKYGIYLSGSSSGCQVYSNTITTSRYNIYNIGTSNTIK
jgi:parallel beta-helix repeat protein